MKRKLTPNQCATLRNGPGSDAWWYENAKSIDVYIYKPGHGTMRCRIKRSQLEVYMTRTKPSLK